MFDLKLLDLLREEVYRAVYDIYFSRILVYPTGWEYEEPEIIRNNDELIAYFRETIKSNYDGIEECIPSRYNKYLYDPA